MADCDKATAKGMADFVLYQLSGLDGVSCRPMMGGYVFYIHDRVFGGIYDSGELMVKQTETSIRCMPDSRPEPPLPGARDMLPCTILKNRELLQRMVGEMYAELPQPRKKKKKADTE